MDMLLADNLGRLLDEVAGPDLWPELEASGFVDLLQPEGDGGAGIGLEDLLPVALMMGARPDAPPLLEAMAARAGPGEPSPALLDLLAAGQMAGAMSAVLALSVDHARTRRQFGREIGRFQAVQDHLAVMVEEAAAARMAAHIAFRGAPLEACARRAAVAKLRAGRAAEVVVAGAHAVHGAIGISEAHVLHRYAARLRRWRFGASGDAQAAARLGAWVLSEPRDLTTLSQSL